MSIILKAENISKQYRLGNVGTGTLSHDLNRWWHQLRGKEDPYAKVGAVNNRSVKATEDYVWALKDINFKVQQGEVLGIIGKNGAGKSTLLKILSRVTSPTTGSIKTKGRIASLLEVGTGFHPELTGKENIYLNGAILGMNKAEINNKIDDIIDFSGCQMYIDTPVKRYSSGMRVRLAFAVAAFLEPDILVVDEVLAVGDAEFQKKAVGKMQDISKGEGRTVIFVSHNMAAVKNLCTRGIVLENGISVFEGSAAACVDYYFKQEISKKNEMSLNSNVRKGTGKLRVSDILLLNKAQNPIDSVLSGDEVFVKINVKQYESFFNFSELMVAVNFENKDRRYVLSFISDELPSNFTAVKDNESITLKIPNLYLRASTYKIRVILSESDFSENHFIDVVENGITVQVLANDIYDLGKTNRTGVEAYLPAYFK